METNSGYENAPATILLATHCAVCARPLVDSVSVETGIGPECRKKHGYNIDVPAETRKAANKIVHDIALAQSNPTASGATQIARWALELRSLGFNTLADILIRRTVPVVITDEGDRFAVKAPFSEAFNAAARYISGRRWDAERKVNTFPVSGKRLVFHALCEAFSGLAAVGPKGAFTLGEV